MIELKKGYIVVLEYYTDKGLIVKKFKSFEDKDNFLFNNPDVFNNTYLGYIQEQKGKA